MLRHMYEADIDKDFRLTKQQLLETVRAIGCNVTSAEIDDLVEAMPKEAPEHENMPRFLDVLTCIALQNKFPESMVDPSNPKVNFSDENSMLSTMISDIEVEDLRISFKKAGVSYEDFRERLSEADNFHEVKEYFFSAMGDKDKHS